MSWWKRFGNDPFDRQATDQASSLAHELLAGLWTVGQARAWTMAPAEARGYFRALARPQVCDSLQSRRLEQGLRTRVEALALDEVVERLLARLREARQTRGRQAA